MSDPVAFITRLTLREGKTLDALRPMWRDAAAELDADKPGTLVFLSFANESATEISIIHVFASAEAMDRHIEGSEVRSRRAFEFVAPLGWEIYGAPSEAAVENLRRAANAGGVDLTVYPEFVSGFLHRT